MFAGSNVHGGVWGREVVIALTESTLKLGEASE